MYIYIYTDLSLSLSLLMPIYSRLHPKISEKNRSKPPRQTEALTRDGAWVSARWTSMVARQGRVAPQQKGGDPLSDQPGPLFHVALRWLLTVYNIFFSYFFVYICIIT